MADSSMPSGAIVAFGGQVAPSGWLLCDGRLVSRCKYSSLFAAIGTAHGAGNGRTTFALPDYRGRFLRGVDSGASNDPDATTRTAASSGGSTGDSVGSVQAQATRKNGLALSDPGHAHTLQISGGASGLAALTGVTTNGTFGGTTSTASTGVSLGNGDNETRPVNAAVHFIIKT